MVLYIFVLIAKIQFNLLTEAEVISKEKLKQQKEELDHAKAVFEAHKHRMEEINKRQQSRGNYNISSFSPFFFSFFSF